MGIIDDHESDYSTNPITESTYIGGGSGSYEDNNEDKLDNDTSAPSVVQVTHTESNGMNDSVTSPEKSGEPSLIVPDNSYVDKANKFEFTGRESGVKQADYIVDGHEIETLDDRLKGVPSIISTSPTKEVQPVVDIVTTINHEIPSELETTRLLSSSNSSIDSTSSESSEKAGEKDVLLGQSPNDQRQGSAKQYMMALLSQPLSISTKDKTDTHQEGDDVVFVNSDLSPNSRSGILMSGSCSPGPIPLSPDSKRLK